MLGSTEGLHHVGAGSVAQQSSVGMGWFHVGARHPRRHWTSGGEGKPLFLFCRETPLITSTLCSRPAHTPRFLLSEMRNVTQSFNVTFRVPIGHVENVTGVAAVTPPYEFWANVWICSPRTSSR